VTGQWFSPGTSVSSTNKTESHDIAEILLKVALNTITLTKPFVKFMQEGDCLLYFIIIKKFYLVNKLSISSY
jgi:hypothetical protein